MGKVLLLQLSFPQHELHFESIDLAHHVGHKVITALKLSIQHIQVGSQSTSNAKSQHHTGSVNSGKEKPLNSQEGNQFLPELEHMLELLATVQPLSLTTVQQVTIPHVGLSQEVLLLVMVQHTTTHGSRPSQQCPSRR